MVAAVNLSLPWPRFRRSMRVLANWRRITGIGQRHRVTAERISEAVRGAHELGSTGRVAECRPNFGHEVGEVGFGDECAGPQTFLQVRFRERLRPLEHERRQQFERLRLEMNFLAGVGQLPALEIERERAEANAHCGSLDESCKIPGNPLESPGTCPPRGGYFTCASPRVRRVYLCAGS